MKGTAVAQRGTLLYRRMLSGSRSPLPLDLGPSLVTALGIGSFTNPQPA